ncbi:MAG: GNAT superfamily N-acetyltransferase [Arenicella sp.]|jgi:GNAT superfamily N-acetyltransferase
MEINIRKGESKDIQATYDLIKELAIYEKAGDKVVNTPEGMLKDGFGENPVFQLFVAENEGKVIGIALYFFSYSTWKGRCLYLDDLVVSEKLRGNGIGKMLIEKLIEEAKAQNCAMVHWQVLDWNEPAIRFYKRLNANLDGEWVNCKVVI